MLAESNNFVNFSHFKFTLKYIETPVPKYLAYLGYKFYFLFRGQTKLAAYYQQFNLQLKC